MPLPKGKKHYKMTKRSWSGLNYRQTIDTGALSMENNISTLEAPYLTPSQKPIKFTDNYANPISMFGFDDFLIVIHRKSTSICVDYITVDEYGDADNIYTGVLQNGGATIKDEYPRCVVQFNVYDTPTDPVSGKYDKKLLIFPDKKSMDFEITGDFKTDDMGEAVPNIKYAAVHLSRLFGVDDARVYASGYNDYTNWNLDTIDEYNESNAWCSPAQSNTKAGGVFTGITNFQGHIVCFKRDFMHEIYNTKNPFRIQDIYAEGAIDHRTIQDVDGRLIFVSEDDVKIYTGSNPRIIGYNLNMTKCKYAVSGTDNRNYYLYCEDASENKYLYVYDTYTDLWSEQSITDRVINFAHNKNGMYMLCSSPNGETTKGIVYKMDTNEYSHHWSLETDLITNETVNIKHIKKIQMFADIQEESEAWIKVYFLYDEETFDGLKDEEKEKRLMYSSDGYGQKAIRVKPRQTASYGIKLHIEGYGYVKLYELELFMENGGDLYV